MRLTFRTVLAAGAFASCPHAVLAQATAPVRHVDIGVSATAIYDDNFARGDRARAALRGLSRADTRFTPALTVDALLPFGRQSLSLVGSAGYDIYARNERYNRERISGTGVLTAQAGRCDGSLRGSYTRQQSDLGDLTFLDPNVTDGRSLRNVEDIKVLSATAICGGDVGLKPTVTVDHARAENSSTPRKTRNYRSTGVSGGIAYARPTLGLATLFGSYRKTTYPNRALILGAGIGDGFETKGGGLRYERGFGSRLTGLAEVSYTSVSPDRPNVPKFDGPTWRLQATARVTDRFQLVANTARAIEASNRVDANYIVNRLYELTGSYAVGDRLTLDAFARRQLRDFRGVETNFGLPLINDQSTRFGGGATYSRSRRLSVRVFAERERRNANGTFFDYTSNRVGLGLNSTF